MLAVSFLADGFYALVTLRAFFLASAGTEGISPGIAAEPIESPEETQPHNPMRVRQLFPAEESHRQRVYHDSPKHEDPDFFSQHV